VQNNIVLNIKISKFLKNVENMYNNQYYFSIQKKEKIIKFWYFNIYVMIIIY
jgi:hypothetical protein